MSIFALIEIEEVRGQIKFYKLVIDENCQFEEFVENLETRYESQLSSTYAWMEESANLRNVPITKMRDITEGETKEYEYKSKHLRVYTIQQKHIGRIVILGGYKNKQTKEMKKFRSIMKRYLESL